MVLFLVVGQVLFDVPLHSQFSHHMEIYAFPPTPSDRAEPLHEVLYFSFAINAFGYKLELSLHVPIVVGPIFQIILCQHKNINDTLIKEVNNKMMNW